MYYVLKIIFPFHAGSVGALEELLEICQHDVSLNISDHRGRTPLHLACIGGHGELVDILLNRGGELCNSVTDFQS